MDEATAKTKWCPFVRMVTGKITPGRTEHAMQPAANRIVDGDTYAWPKAGGCIASACMAWRWSSVIETQGQRIPMPQGQPDGFCGLAGAPQP